MPTSEFSTAITSFRLTIASLLPTADAMTLQAEQTTISWREYGRTVTSEMKAAVQPGWKYRAP